MFPSRSDAIRNVLYALVCIRVNKAMSVLQDSIFGDSISGDSVFRESIFQDSNYGDSVLGGSNFSNSSPTVKFSNPTVTGINNTF